MPEPTTPTPSTPIDKYAFSQMLLDKLEVALAELQRAQEQLTGYTTSLDDHNSSDEAHPDIRAKLNDIIAGTGFATNEYVNTTVVNAIVEHNVSAEAHPLISGKISEVATEVALLDKRLKKLEPATEDPTDPTKTELQRRLKAIDDYYDPTLAELQKAWDAANIQGLPTANQIAIDFQILLAEKTAARKKVLKEFM